MAGTKEGGLKAAQVNKERWGADFYANIGRAGGAKSRGGGVTGNRERAREIGRKGGLATAKVRWGKEYPESV